MDVHIDMHMDLHICFHDTAPLIPKNSTTWPEGLRAEATQIVHQAAANGHISCARSMVLDLGCRYPASLDVFYSQISETVMGREVN